MRKTWITADWHLGEIRLNIMGRPFDHSIDHIKALIKQHNSLVSPGDDVIVLGDICYQKDPGSLLYVDEFYGRKTLVRGNHDRVFTDEQLKPYFERIIPDGHGLEMGVGGIPLYLTHYPTEGRQDRFNLVGHVHAAWKYQLNMFNVGVDANHFRPVDLESIPFHLTAISQYYDNDVWVAYNALNESYKGKRGKAGTYFRPPQ